MPSTANIETLMSSQIRDSEYLNISGTFVLRIQDELGDRELTVPDP